MELSIPVFFKLGFRFLIINASKILLLWVLLLKLCAITLKLSTVTESCNNAPECLATWDVSHLACSLALTLILRAVSPI